MKILKPAIAILSTLIFLYGCSATKTTNVAENMPLANVPTNTQIVEIPDEVAMGAKLYSTNCAKCHREDGTGGKITVDGKELDPDNLKGKRMIAFTDEKLASKIKIGAEDDGMPAFKDKLTDDQIKQVVKFIRQDLQKVPPKPAV
jgi:mono/diheme cytochrome c family protein